MTFEAYLNGILIACGVTLVVMFVWLSYEGVTAYRSRNRKRNENG